MMKMKKTIIMPYHHSMIGHHDEDSDIKSEDEAELPPVNPPFGGGQYQGGDRIKCSNYKAAVCRNKQYIVH